MIQPAQHTDNPYDQFAPVYNSHWGQNSLHFLPVYQQHVFADLPQQSRILDLCCGSGQFADALTRRGFRVVGVDLSEELLGFAAQNAPGGTFLSGDIRRFRSESRFDAAVSVYDSLNHLLTFNDLNAAFETAYRCLKSNGVFAFDMNMEAKYRDSWRGEFAVSGSDEVYAIVSRANVTQRLATLVAFRKSNQSFDAEDGILFWQTWYSEVDIVRGLKTTGFDQIKAVSLNAPELNDPERMLFVCRKP
jgi:SAM-dependent methyltransferase